MKKLEPSKIDITALTKGSYIWYEKYCDSVLNGGEIMDIPEFKELNNNLIKLRDKNVRKI